MNSYYFKIKTDVGDAVCEFMAKDYDRAFRNMMFACFSDLEGSAFKKRVPDVEDRFRVLLSKYNNRVTIIEEETFNRLNEYQND